MMKRAFLLLFLICACLIGNAQVKIQYFPHKDALKNILEKRKVKAINRKVHRMPTFDLKKMQEEDAQMDNCDVPYRFGKDFDVRYGLEDGEWQKVEGGRMWSITFESTGALSLNFIFNDFHLPDGGNLYISNQEQTVLYGPVTQDAIGPNGFFLTDIIPGANVSICLFEPSDKIGESSLVIQRIIHGYRSINTDEYYNLISSSESCDIDVACRPDFEKESRGVGLVLLANGKELCSGALIMSTDMSFKPYFLTAFHCIDRNPANGILSESEITQAENWMFKFSYKQEQCGGTVSPGYSYNSASLRAAWASTDFALMEINHDLTENPNLSWLGWDRSGNTPTSGSCIHHPCGSV